MGTTSAQIDILTVKQKADIYTVEFWDEACENENFTTMQISEDSLHTFIEENDLNRETFINSRYTNLECDGMDERVINVFDYLENNLQSTIKEYIQFNS